MIEALLTKNGPLTMETDRGDTDGLILVVDVTLRISNPTGSQCRAMIEAGHISATLHLEVSE